jgi:5-methyltetrahydrofolate--homocysteine methyltransferase
MKQRRHDLRNNLTKAEELLWERLKEKRLEGHRFRRQHGIGQYVVDFYHSLSMTIVELDGSIHDESETIENDQWRESFLKENGYKIIRFRNEEIYTDIDSVLEKILLSIKGKS